MSVNNFIPTVWAAEVLLNLHKTEVFAQTGIVNRDYEGEISKQGDTVRITAIGALSVTKYARNTLLPAPQVLSDASTALQINQGDLVMFLIDDLDKRQAAGNLLDAANYEATYAIADSADQYVAGLMTTNVSGANIVGTDTSPQTDLAVSSGGFSKAYDYLVTLGVKLDQANVPRQGRWAIVPPFYEGLLMRDLRFVGYGTTPNRDALTNGVIGTAAGFEIFKSNNIKLTGSGSNVYNVLAGTPAATTFADQLVESEAYRSQQYLGDVVRMVHVYDCKVVRPQAIACLKCQDPGT